MTALLRATGLTKTFRVRGGTAHAVERIDLTVGAGEALGIVGESGCGKSTTARMLVRLLEPTGGRLEFDGVDITHLPQRRLRPLRRDLQIVFQDPFSSLNPRYTVGAIVGAPLRAQRADNPDEQIARILEKVGLRREHIDRYPHEFSGGQAQRIGIARALVTHPKLVIADEPVSALDVSIQAQIVNLLAELQNDLGLSYVFISHDLAVVRHVCTRIAVMYLGRIVETGDRDTIYTAPAHPYTAALLSAAPTPDPAAERNRRAAVLLGEPPSPINPPAGCPFHPRCPKARQHCRETRPELTTTAGHQVACHYPD